MEETQDNKRTILSITPLTNGRSMYEVIYHMMETHEQISLLHKELAICASELEVLEREGVMPDQGYKEQAQCYLEIASFTDQQLKRIEGLFCEKE